MSARKFEELRQKREARQKQEPEVEETPVKETTDASRVRFAPSIKWFIGDPARETRLRK
jgi:hypothetical protein